MLESLFVLSAVGVICHLCHWLPMVFSGNVYSFPVPFLHFLKISFANVYISVPCIGFQVWFWANHLGLF